MSVKKQSLFKQKLKQAKKMQVEKEAMKEQSAQIESFPKVFKIDKFDINSQFDRDRRASQMNEKMVDETEQQFQKQQELSYLKKHQQGLMGVISEDELNQINNQNWNAVNAMNQEQRKNYLNMIQNTLPKHFIEKLKKKQVAPKIQKPKKNLTQMVPEISKLSLSQKNKINETSVTKQEQTNDQSQEHKNVMDQIYLNIKSGKLIYLQENVLATLNEDEKSNMINKLKIYEMLTAQNNQSQIVGSQLTLTWLKNIYPTQNTVFLVDNIPFHSRIMLSEIHQLLKVIESNLKSTKFYSCYIEMLVKSVQILTIIYKNLSDSQLDYQLSFVKTQFQKTQKSLKDLLNSKTHFQESLSNQQQQKQMLFESLGILYQSIKQEKERREESQKSIKSTIDIEETFQKVTNKQKMNDLVEAMLIEQTLRKEEFQKYEITPSINTFLQTLCGFWLNKIGKSPQNFNKKFFQMNQFYDSLYQLICRLNKKQRAFIFYRNLIKSIYSGLLEVIEEVYLKNILENLLSKKNPQKQKFNQNNLLKSLKNQIFFKILFIYRQLACDTQKFACFLEKQKQNWIITQDQASILIFVNFDHYMSAQDLKAEEIKMLETMLGWLLKELQQKQNKQVQKTFLNFNELLISLLKLFLSSQQQVYSLLDQNLLLKVFKEAILFYESNKERLTPILSENQIKKMVQNYNFNSFGNDIFTKVIFWIAVSISPEFEVLIAEQVMMRYPMLFYYACEPILISSKSQFVNPLLGDLKYYMQIENHSSNNNFSYSSNESVKQSLLKVLSLNLDFEHSGIYKIQRVRKALNLHSKGETEGFNIFKNKLNEQNYFLKYLIQPFLQPV